MVLYFWQNIPSMILSPLVRALIRECACQVKVIFCDEVPDRRRKLGWEMPDYGTAEIIYLSNHDFRSDIDDIVSKCSPQVCHIVSGISGYKKLSSVTEKLFARKIKPFILSEAGAGYGWKKLPTIIKYFVHIRRYDKHIKGYLLMGNLGCSYFNRLGVDRKKIFKFSYLAPQSFEDCRSTLFPKTRITTSPLNLLYVGQLTKRKGVDILLKALIQLEEECPYTLKIVGTGNEVIKLKLILKKHKLEDKCTFLGAIKSSELPEIYKKNDMLVVPSRYDGWAAVANEALSSGIPVLISDRCGAADMIMKTGAGMIFRSGNPKELRYKIKSVINDELLYNGLAEKAFNSYHYINSSAMAAYLSGVLKATIGNYKSPNIPWQKCKTLSEET